MLSQLPEDAPAPRLCLIVKSGPNEEYGYNLHAERGKPQFIGTVDSGSAADRGGLRPGDRIFAVNGHSIIGENHKQVVQRIKENPLQCELLVISEEGAEWYKRHDITITPALPNILNCCKSKQEGSRLEKTVAKSNSNQAMATVLRPRLCKLRKREPSEEFGFNLHAEEKRGHFVGAVDKGGIGERAGLEMGQRIVGVNGQITYPTTAHKKVVSLIKMNPLRTDLLVASEEVDNWYAENHLTYSFDNAELYSSENDRQSTHESNKMESQQCEVREKSDQAPIDGVISGPPVVHAGPVDDQVDRQLEQQPVMMASQSANDSSVNVIVGDSRGSVETLELKQDPEYAPVAGGSSETAADRTESNFSPHSVPKMTASVAPLKQNEAPTSKPYDEKKFGNSDAIGKHAEMDIFMLSADEARNRLVKGKKDPRRDLQMTLQEKYKLVSNM